MKSALPIALLISIAAACGKSQFTMRGQAAPSAGRVLSTAEVYDGLSSSCRGCHQAGMSLPFFSSLAAFENLVVYNDRYVHPGGPDNSELVRLLQGTGSGTNRQMPVGGDPYAIRVQRGEGRVSMAEIRLWIAHLTPRQGPPAQASDDAALVRRKSAEQIVATLKVQLGLTDGDFPGPYADGSPELYPARSPDGVPAIGSEAETNYLTLGGASWLRNKKPNFEPTTLFTQQLVPMSQAWCRLAIQKPSNPILVEASLSDSTTASDGLERIRRNIARLHLRMLGEAAGDTEIAELVNLFQAYEPANEAAWTAVCSALIRHPLWITF